MTVSELHSAESDKPQSMRMMPLFKNLVVALTLSAGTVSLAIAHGGGLDDQGCHNDSSTGQYHCHQGKHAGESFDSESALTPNGQAYDRADYHSSWRDRDDDCQDTREEVLIRQSQVPVEFETARECNVVAGEWRDPYSGEVFQDPSKLDIDHLVPLAEAHKSGAKTWPAKRKHAYANDLSHPDALIAVSAGENRSKSADDPAEWMPSNDDFHCEYIERWLGVKRKWGLTMDDAEREAVQSMNRRCQ